MKKLVPLILSVAFLLAPNVSVFAVGATGTQAPAANSDSNGLMQVPADQTPSGSAPTSNGIPSSQTVKVKVGSGSNTKIIEVPIEDKAAAMGINASTITPGGSYKTDPHDPRNDYVYNPFPADFIGPKLPDKLIYVSIKHQNLTYYEDGKQVGQILVSTGVPGRDTPPGQYVVHHKYPLVDYNGVDYSFKNTKWNMLFRYGPSHGDYFIHGAYWHHNFGHKMSHGCINVSYKDVEGLYNWADVGTRVVVETD